MKGSSVSQAITVVLLLVLVLFSGIAWHNTYSISNNLATSPGDWGRYLLRGDEFGRLVFEVDRMKNTNFNGSALALLEKSALKYMDKPGGIRTEISSEIPQKDFQWTYNISEITMLESKYRENKPDAFRGEMTVYILYLNGWYRDESGSTAKKVLGLTYHASSVVIFQEAVWYKEPPLLAWKKEAAVLIHELGHLMGLVNIGYRSTFDHEHSVLTKDNETYKRDYDKHCNDSHCVMYPEIELQTGDTINQTFSTDYCKNCSGDLSSLKSGYNGRVISRYIFLAMTITAAVVTAVYIAMRMHSRKKDGDTGNYMANKATENSIQDKYTDAIPSPPEKPSE